MKSLKELYRIGLGPSSSHTIAPYSASLLFAKEYPNASSYSAVLYGSLARTGKGHRTDKAICQAFAPTQTHIDFNTDNTDIPHPNTMDLVAHMGDKEYKWRVVSTGGGAFSVVEGGSFSSDDVKSIYPHSTFDEIKKYCIDKNIRLSDYVFEVEGSELFEYLMEVRNIMFQAIDKGLSAQGILEGGLNVVRKARWLYSQRHIDESPETRENRLVCAYAFAVSEHNAGGGRVVTAPTCGASGVLPSVLRYMQEKKKYDDEKIVRALAVAGLIGNLIKFNGSISGAECGCQAEIGSACSMAAAALGELYEMDIEQIEYAAEMSLEHHLGLTCDPICGLVQIPCIERNAVAAMRAITAASLASFLTHTRKISFDLIVKTMYETGKDIPSSYRETSVSGLAKLYIPRAPKNKRATVN